MHALFPLVVADPLVMALAIGLGLGAVGLSRNVPGIFRGVPLRRCVSLAYFCRRPQAGGDTQQPIKETP